MFILTIFISSQAAAYLGKPCNPETDFKYAYLIKNWRKIPSKNQEETLAQVNWVNKMAGAKVWKYNPKSNRPVWACLSFGSSSVADWWAMELGRKLNSYKSLVNGKIERGYNPRKLEAIYMKRSKTDFKSYWYVPKAGLIRKLASPNNPVGYAKILTDRAFEKAKDPTIPGVEFNLKSDDYPMEKMWKSVLDGKKRHNSNLLIDAIRNHGPLLCQLELDLVNFLPGAHTPILIGYGITKKDPRKIVFIIHDSYGNHPSDYKQDEHGGSLYRYVPAHKIDEAIAFPHLARVYYKRFANKVVLRFSNSANLPVKVKGVFLKDNKGNFMRLSGISGKSKIVIKNSQLPKDFNIGNFLVYINADYYAGMNGKGYWVKPRKI